jgi:hypothetical protein
MLRTVLVGVEAAGCHFRGLGFGRQGPAQALAQFVVLHRLADVRRECARDGL